MEFFEKFKRFFCQRLIKNNSYIESLTIESSHNNLPSIFACILLQLMKLLTFPYFGSFSLVQ
jgi:hypothetical protein